MNPDNAWALWISENWREVKKGVKSYKICVTNKKDFVKNKQPNLSRFTKKNGILSRSSWEKGFQECKFEKKEKIES
jgi:hypothetical protein